MDISSQKKISSLIASLADIGNASDAEHVMGQVLDPLLAEDGYTVEVPNGTRDNGIDFLARKKGSLNPTADAIGIEYKHYRSQVGSNVVRSLIGAAVVMGINRVMLVTNSRFSHSAHELIRHNAPLRVELMDIDALRSWVERIRVVPSMDVSEVTIIRRTMTHKLISLICRNPRALDEIEWREMEYVLTEVFNGLGFEATLTPGSKDGGKDIVLTCEIATKIHRYYVEVKHWRSGQRVGTGAVSEFLKVTVNEKIDGGLFLSTYGFSSSAVESLTELQRKTLRFGEESKVVSLCDSYVKAKSGIWSPDEQLSELLYEGTL